EAARVARAAADDVRARLGGAVYAEGDTSFAASVGALLLARSYTFGIAESCTGGLLSDLVAVDPGASAYFRGAVVSYNESVKTALLSVPRDLLVRASAVSEEVARAMAEGARKALSADVAVAVTGIAG